MTVGESSEPPSTPGPPSMEGAPAQPTGVATPASYTDQELLDNFPVAKLTKLDELISNPRWVIPVLPGGELEVLLEYSIELCKRKLDTQSEHCQRFFREGLTVSFQKIMTDEAVSSWRFDIHKCILKNCERLVSLVCTKVAEDWFPLLELLALVFNPSNKFHVYNSSRATEETVANGEAEGEKKAEAGVWALSVDTRQPRGWLVDLLNVFGASGGFQLIHDRITTGNNLTVPLISALVRPFGFCYELLALNTVKQYFLPVIEAVPKFLENLTDEELKKESKNESKNDSISSIVKSLKNLLSLVPGREEDVKTLEMFRLKMLLRQLQISSFSGKMSALNEVNKVISGVIYTPQRQTVTVSNQTNEDEDWLTADRMAAWIRENKVIKIVLRDNLHQPQYVEKLEKMIRFVIKEKSLSLSDLDDIWAAQDGKHEAIVKNVHDLLAKLAWDFSPEQLDHLFECFQDSWRSAVARQRERLLELIRRLAEDDKDGVMADKVLKLFWTLAHSSDASTDIMDQALAAHVKILDYSCTQYREQQKSRWLDKCVEELKTNDKWVLPALKQIKEICSLYQEQPANGMHGGQRTATVVYRSEVINRLQQSHALVIQIADNLTSYMASIKAGGEDIAKQDPNDFSPDGRYSHTAQVSERLNFLRFLLRDGQLWLCAPQAKQIWHCLAEDAIFSSDREICFKWFSKLMGDEPDLDPEINRDFFESNLLKLDPALLTEAGMKCFERFFKAVNCKEGKLTMKRRATLMDDLELIGLDYIWKVVLCSSDTVSSKAIDLLKETFTNLGPRLLSQQVEIHEDFIGSCMDRLKASFDTVTVLQAGDGGRKDGDKSRMEVEILRLCRVLCVLVEYVSECDAEYQEERSCIPLFRAARGKQLTLTVRFPNSGHKVEDMEFWVHDNDTLASLRRMIFQKLKANPMNIKLELLAGQELLDVADDRKILAFLPIRDKSVITAKLSQTGSGAGASSPDSSSESSGGSPQHHLYEGPNLETEQCLPGVLMSQRQNHAVFLCQLAELGVSLNSEKLRTAAWQLLCLLPPDMATVARIQSTTASAASNKKANKEQLEKLFMSGSDSLTLYTLECCLTLVMPAGGQGPMSDKAYDFQLQLVKAGGVGLVLHMLTTPTFLQKADITTKKAAFFALLKLTKFLLAVAGHSLFFLVVESQQPSSSTRVSDSTHNHAVMLQQALQAGIPCPGEVSIRQAVTRLGQNLLEAGADTLPDIALVKSVQRLAWAASAADIDVTDFETLKKIHKQNSKNKEGIDGNYAKLAREALEVLTMAIALCPTALESLSKDKSWHGFLVDLVLLCPDLSVRQTAADQFLLMTSRATSDTTHVKMMVTVMFTIINSLAEEFADQSSSYFFLLTRLLSYLSSNSVVLNNSGALLSRETEILASVRQSVLTTGNTGVSNTTLEGHLNITRELVMFLSTEKKLEIGTGKVSNGTSGLIRELVEDWIFPASKLWVVYNSSGDISHDNSVIHPVCQTQGVTAAAFDLLVALCTGCPGNLTQVARMLSEMFYSGDEVLSEWEFLPPVGPRPSQGFVGLKNAGATCYMNSVLQQLFMLRGIKEGILSCNQACTDPDEDFSGEERLEIDTDNEEEDRGDYNLTILKQVQAIFGHLSSTQLQYYIPRGLWRHFRMLGEPVNLREQQDAVEFFMTLIDTLDEALKSVGYEQFCSKVLGGVISDQKICKPCPHRYTRQEPCSVIPVDVKNYSNLMDSLAEYTKGELLETENAYYCERCDKKVDTVKRLVVKKLPPILVIQLKRFDYDFERDAAVKFNDYFEFPRELDMEPYTVAGMAKRENEAVDCEPEDLDPNVIRKYNLRGMVVHSGQASGGHYYSYIKDGQKWYKFDDGDVTEVNMEDDEELKTQCWGGEYMSEVFDHMLKRMSYRRQKRWWNAYMLFYCRSDLEPASSEAELVKSVDNMRLTETSENKFSDKDLNTNAGVLSMPKPIRKSILKQNVKFLHNRNQFSLEYFNFMKKLIQCNAPFVTVGQGEKLSKDGEDISLTTVQLASSFLFSVGFHTKKSLRGNATDWYEILSQHLRCSATSRAWFANNVLFSQPSRFSEYLLECPSPEVRQAVSKLIVFTAHFAASDPPSPIPACLSNIPVEISPTSGLSDHLLLAVLALLWVEVSEHGRHLSQYFNLFAIYANLGSPEKTQLLKLNVPSLFISVSLDDGPGPPIKYQYAELGKLYQVVSTLVRCCDVSSLAQSAIEGQTPLPNPFMDQSLNHNYLMPLQAPVSDLLFNRYGYLKKLIEEANQSEDTKRLLQFCCWENPLFSHAVLYELLWQIAFAYTYELRPYLDLLLYILCIEDSWQTHRIHKALKGIPDDHSSRDGLFETIQRSKNHYQKRAYQCIKMLVSLFSQCGAARSIMESAGDLKRRWTWSVEWLHDELERGGGGTGHRTPYTSTAGSNETANGYFLERSQSARQTLEKACELLPDDEEGEGATAGDGEAGTEAERPKSSAETGRRPGGSITSGQPLASVTSPQPPGQGNKGRMRRRRDALAEPE